MRYSARAALLLSASIMVAAADIRDASAGCAPAPPYTAASETIVCDAATPPNPDGPFDFGGGNDSVKVNSGTYTGPFFFPSGNNTLIFGLGGGAPVLNGAVTFAGVGSNSMEVHSGIITGAVSQGSGVDTFLMMGGQILSLSQGDGTDTFVMSGGTIVGAFEDGDIAKMTGGTIGRVDMKLGANVFEMAGGAILGNLVTGFDKDTIVVSGGVIGGNISVSGGADNVTVTGGAIGGSILMSFGSDAFAWSGGGTVAGRIDMGPDNDTALLRNLTSANLGKTQLFDGGAGQDSIVFDNAEVAGIARFVNWEALSLINRSRVTMDGNLTLGDAGTLTGALAIDATSTLLAGNGQHAITPLAPGQLVAVVNAGTIDLTNGGDSTADRLIIAGNYLGSGGRLIENAFLAGDGSPSDRLVLDRGAATGTTSLLVKNVGGLGNMTTGNGILVVDTINGGTTAPGAFVLGAPVIAGPYEYTLVRGSVDASNPQAWYLRSSFDCSQPDAPSPCEVGVGPGGTVMVANYRQEVSLYAALPALSLLYGRTLIDTLSQRIGDQDRLDCDPCSGASRSVWGRIIAQRGDHDGGRLGIYGNDGPSFDFDFGALQLGLDVYRARLADGSRHHAGLYGALGDGRSSVTHFNGILAGRDTFAAYTAGGYWTMFWPTGWRVDGVVQGTWYTLKADSTRLAPLETDGAGVAASVEAGKPFPLFAGIAAEPQTQLVYQSINIGDARDIAAQVRFDSIESLAARVGVRFAATWTLPAGLWGAAQPALMTAWFRPNFWHEFSGDPRTLFLSQTGFIPFRANVGDDWVELNSGISARVDRSTELYVNASYQFGLDGDTESWSGKFGFKLSW